MDKLNIVPFNPVDQREIDLLLKCVWGSNPPGYPIGKEITLRGRSQATTYVGKVKGQLIGFMCVWQNSFHPYTLYFTIQVHPDFQYQGVGSEFFNLLHQIKPDSLPLQTSLWETSLSVNGFLQKHGFQEIRRTYEPKLILANIDQLDYICTAPFEMKGYTVTSLTDLPAERQLEFVGLAKRCYERTHQVNPPAERTLEEWRQLIFSDVILEGSFVATDQDTVVGFALLHENGKDGVDLGWRGVDLSKLSDEKDLIVTLTRYQIQFADENQIKVIHAEIDSTDPWAIMVYDYFPFETAPAWVTYQWKK